MSELALVTFWTLYALCNVVVLHWVRIAPWMPEEDSDRAEFEEAARPENTNPTKRSA